MNRLTVYIWIERDGARRDSDVANHLNNLSSVKQRDTWRR